MEVIDTPFLSLPFSETNYYITEGWHYSEEEQNIHEAVGHGGIDFALPRGTEILAATDGWAIASYFHRIVKNKDGTVRLYQGKEVGTGLGYFVQIYHPKGKLYTAYGHLEQIASEIPFHRPIKIGNTFWPVGHKIIPERLPEYKFAKYVKRGEPIGYVGDSGLTWGYEDYLERPDPKIYPSWDETHLHFEVFQRLGFLGKKKFFDPFGIKSDAKDYPDSKKPENRKNLGTKGPILWMN